MQIYERTTPVIAQNQNIKGSKILFSIEMFQFVFLLLACRKSDISNPPRILLRKNESSLSFTTSSKEIGNVGNSRNWNRFFSKVMRT